MPKKKFVIAVAAILLVGAGAVAGSKMFSPAAAKVSSPVTSANTDKISVKTVTVKTAAISSDVSFDASLEASKEGIVSSKVGGKVLQVYFQNGQAVSEGQPLVKLDDTDIRNNIKTSEAQLAAVQSQLNSVTIGLQKAQIALETAQNNYNREKALYDQQVISKSEWENAQATLKSAQVDLQTSQAGVASQQANLQASKVSLSILNETLKNTTITAPIGGVIDAKNVDVGQFVSTGAALAKVENVSPIYADIAVSGNSMDDVKLGTAAKFLLNGDSTEYSGTVANISGTADPATRSFACKVKIDNAEGKLRPGVFGMVKIAVNGNRKAITLPVQALGGTAGEYYVFVNQNGVARKQAITTGEILQDTVEVKSGVKDGDIVIRTNVATLQDGDAIKVVA